MSYTLFWNFDLFDNWGITTCMINEFSFYHGQSKYVQLWFSGLQQKSNTYCDALDLTISWYEFYANQNVDKLKFIIVQSIYLSI
jgi:hypothetical protein